MADLCIHNIMCAIDSQVSAALTTRNEIPIGQLGMTSGHPHQIVSSWFAAQILL